MGRFHFVSHKPPERAAMSSCCIQKTLLGEKMVAITFFSPAKPPLELAYMIIWSFLEVACGKRPRQILVGSH